MSREAQMWTLNNAKLWSACWCECTLRCAARSLAQCICVFFCPRIKKRMCVPPALCCNGGGCGVIRKKHDPATHYGWWTLAARASGYLYERAPVRPGQQLRGPYRGRNVFRIPIAVRRIHYRTRRSGRLHLRIWRRRPFWAWRKSGLRFGVSKNREIEFGAGRELMTQPPAFKTPPPVSTRTFHALSCRRFSARQARQRKVSLKKKGPGEKILRLSMGEEKMVKCALRVTNAFDTRQWIFWSAIQHSGFVANISAKMNSGTFWYRIITKVGNGEWTFKAMFSILSLSCFNHNGILGKFALSWHFKHVSKYVYVTTLKIIIIFETFPPICNF